MSLRTRLIAAVLATASVGVAGCGLAPVTGTSSDPVAITDSGTTMSPVALFHQLPGLGPRTLAQIPGDTGQVIVATGAAIDSPSSTVVFYQRTPAGWQAGASRPAHNGLYGWSDHETDDNLRSPIGVFSLTDAGGLLPNPGSRLSYHRSTGFAISGIGFDGESLAGAFDYVIAINYNRVPGTSPLNWGRPLGTARGGDIWLHVDHGGPTQGCISLPADEMVTLLRTLDPGQHPLIVMGDSASLAH